MKQKINKIIEQEISRDDLIFKAGTKKNTKTYDFQSLKQSDFLKKNVSSGFIILNDAFEGQINSKNQTGNFNECTIPKSLNIKEGRLPIYENADRIIQGRQNFFL